MSLAGLATIVGRQIASSHIATVVFDQRSFVYTRDLLEMLRPQLKASTLAALCFETLSSMALSSHGGTRSAAFLGIRFAAEFCRLRDEAALSLRQIGCVADRLETVLLEQARSTPRIPADCARACLQSRSPIDLDMPLVDFRVLAAIQEEKRIVVRRIAGIPRSQSRIFFGHMIALSHFQGLFAKQFMQRRREAASCCSDSQQRVAMRVCLLDRSPSEEQVDLLRSHHLAGLLLILCAQPVDSEVSTAFVNRNVLCLGGMSRRDMAAIRRFSGALPLGSLEEADGADLGAVADIAVEEWGWQSAEEAEIAESVAFKASHMHQRSPLLLRVQYGDAPGPQSCVTVVLTDLTHAMLDILESLFWKLYWISRDPDCIPAGCFWQLQAHRALKNEFCLLLDEEDTASTFAVDMSAFSKIMWEFCVCFLRNRYCLSDMDAICRILQCSGGEMPADAHDVPAWIATDAADSPSIGRGVDSVAQVCCVIRQAVLLARRVAALTDVRAADIPVCNVCRPDESNLA